MNRHIATLVLTAAFFVPAAVAHAGDELMLEPMWQRIADLNGEKGAVETAEFSNDGTLIASGNKYDNRVTVWRVLDGSVVWSRIADQEVEAVCFSPDDRLLVSGGEDDIARIWDVATGEQIGGLQHSNPIDGLRWSHDGTVLATGEEGGMLRLWRMPEGELIQAVDNEGLTINSIDFTSDDAFIATAAHDGQVRIWSVPDLKVVRELRNNPDDGLHRVSVRITSDDRLVAASGYGGFVMVWRFDDGKLLKTLNYTGRKVEAIEFTPDGEYLLSAGFEPRIFVTRTSNFSLAHTSSHSGPTEYLAFSPNGAMMVSAHEDGTIRLWLWVSENPSINHEEHKKLQKRQAAAAAARAEEQR